MKRKRAKCAATMLGSWTNHTYTCTREPGHTGNHVDPTEGLWTDPPPAKKCPHCGKAVPS